MLNKNNMRRDGYPKILAFHDVAPVKRLGINTYLQSDFEKLIELLRAEGYDFVTVSKILKSGINEKSVALSFDDAYESVYEYVFPFLQEKGIPASVMLITGFIGKSNNWEPSPFYRRLKHLNTEQINTMRQEGWEFAPHGHNHFAYVKANAELFPEDLENSFLFFENNNLPLPEYFSLPFGISDKKSLDILREHYTAFLGMFNTGRMEGVISRYPVYSFKKPNKIINILHVWPKTGVAEKVLHKGIHAGAAVSVAWQKAFGIKPVHQS